MKTNVCKIALMFLIGTALSLLFNSCSKDPVIPENETDNKLHEDPSKMTIRLVECHLHADWNENTESRWTSPESGISGQAHETYSGNNL